MISWWLLLEHSLVYGSVLSVVLTSLVLSTLFFWPRIWIASAPADIQQALGGVTMPEQRKNRAMKFLILSSVLGLIGASVAHLYLRSNGQISFSAVAISVFLILQVWNIVDFVIIDWLLLIRLRPAFMMFPEMEHLPGYGDVGFHARGFLKGVMGSLVFAVLLAGITTGVIRLLQG